MIPLKSIFKSWYRFKSLGISLYFWQYIIGFFYRIWDSVPGIGKIDVIELSEIQNREFFDGIFGQGIATALMGGTR